MQLSLAQIGECPPRQRGDGAGWPGRGPAGVRAAWPRGAAAGAEPLGSGLLRGAGSLQGNEKEKKVGGAVRGEVARA